MNRIRILTGIALFWPGSIGYALAQQMNPAPPINESGPGGSNSTAANAAATDFNWVWISLIIAVLVLGAWYVARRRQSGNLR